MVTVQRDVDESVGTGRVGGMAPVEATGAIVAHEARRIRTAAAARRCR
jgi:hypothetical protein